MLEIKLLASSPLCRADVPAPVPQQALGHSFHLLCSIKQGLQMLLGHTALHLGVMLTLSPSNHSHIINDFSAQLLQASPHKGFLSHS